MHKHLVQWLVRTHTCSGCGRHSQHSRCKSILSSIQNEVQLTHPDLNLLRIGKNIGKYGWPLTQLFFKNNVKFNGNRLWAISHWLNKSHTSAAVRYLHNFLTTPSNGFVSVLLLNTKTQLKIRALRSYFLFSMLCGQPTILWPNTFLHKERKKQKSRDGNLTQKKSQKALHSGTDEIKVYVLGVLVCWVILLKEVTCTA